METKADYKYQDIKELADNFDSIQMELNNKIEDLKNANPNKLFNDLNALRKKNKLDIAPLKPEQGQQWINK